MLYRFGIGLFEGNKLDCIFVPADLSSYPMNGQLLYSTLL